MACLYCLKDAVELFGNDREKLIRLIDHPAMVNFGEVTRKILDQFWRSPIGGFVWAVYDNGQIINDFQETGFPSRLTAGLKYTQERNQPADYEHYELEWLAMWTAADPDERVAAILVACPQTEWAYSELTFNEAVARMITACYESDDDDSFNGNLDKECEALTELCAQPFMHPLMPSACG